MKKLVLILAAFALLPVAAAADDLSAELGGACQGIASLVTSGSTISYGILTDHPDPNQAVVMGPAGMADLQANFGGTGSAAGTVSANASDVAALNANPGAFTLRVSGPSGTCQGMLVSTASTGGMGLSMLGRLPGLDVVLVADRLPPNAIHQFAPLDLQVDTLNRGYGFGADLVDLV